jgi:hypothetical protein
MRLKPLIMTYLPQLGLFSSRSRSRTPGTGSGLNGMRSDKHFGKPQHSYQLHSVQKGSAYSSNNSKDIHVYRSYNIDVENTHRGGSTDRILR